MNKNKLMKTAINEELLSHNVAGASVALVENFKIKKLYSFGTNTQKDARIDNKTLFQVASISKTVFALMVMNLHQKGLIDIDENVENYLGDYEIPNNKKKNITLRNLLQHTGGINVHGFDGYVGEKIPSTLDILKGQGNSDKIQMTHSVGQHEYSGGGYTIAQYAIENLFDLSFKQIMEKFLFKPLHIKFFEYSTNLSNKKLASDKYHSYPEFAAAGLMCNAKTIAKVGIAVQKSLKNGKFLSVENAKIMTTKGDYPHAVGFRVNKQNNMFWHGGINNDFKSHCLFSKDGKGIVILTNGSSDDVFTAIEEKVVKILDWKNFNICDFRYSQFPS